jgi:hypothetical protein
MNQANNIYDIYRLASAVEPLVSGCHATAIWAQQNLQNPLCEQDCMYTSEPNEITATGLRYTAKEAGSPFEGMGANGEFRSCLKCGQHKLRSNGAIHRFLNGLMFFCFECKPKKLPQ